jgi:DNA-binding NtrC family response regulator
MVEAELFGHERGAFTGALSQRIGMIEQAHGGTLLIDEIGDLDLALQPKLLRAIERHELRRIGGNRSVQLDVRILAATRRNLDREVEAGRFRDDLFHRLAVARVELPPLRRRRGDVAVLAHAFCRALGGGKASIPPETLARWERHTWPGNVRELRNAVARMLALGDLAVSHTGFPAEGVAERDAISHAAESPPWASVADVTRRAIEAGLPLVRARQEVINAFESAYLAAILERHGGVVTRAAAACGIARRHFQRLRARTR